MNIEKSEGICREHSATPCFERGRKENENVFILLMCTRCMLILQHCNILQEDENQRMGGADQKLIIQQHVCG